MLRFARACVGKPFSGTAMARSVIWPRKTEHKNFFCAGKDAAAVCSCVLPPDCMTPVYPCVRRARRRRAEGGRPARFREQPGCRDTGELARTVQGSSNHHCEPVHLETGQLSTPIDDEQHRAAEVLHASTTSNRGSTSAQRRAEANSGRCPAHRHSVRVQRRTKERTKSFERRDQP